MNKYIIAVVFVVLLGATGYYVYQANKWNNIAKYWFDKTEVQEQDRIKTGKNLTNSLLSQDGAKYLHVTQYVNGSATTTIYSFNKECNLSRSYYDFYGQSFDKGWVNYSFYKSTFESDLPNEDTNYELKCN